MNPKKMQYKSGRRKKLNKEQIFTITISVIAIIIMITYCIHNYNVKKYNYIKETITKDLIYTNYYREDDKYIQEIPYINIKSEQVLQANAKIETLSKKYKELKRAIVTYDYQLNGDILSLIIKAISYETDYASETEFLSFNINLETKEIVTDEELLSIYGITTDYVEDKIKEQLKLYHSEIVKEKYYTIQECNFNCFLTWRNIDDYLEGVAYYIDKGKLYAYKPFVFASIFGEEEYFKDDDFAFLIIEEPFTE